MPALRLLKFEDAPWLKMLFPRFLEELVLDDYNPAWDDQLTDNILDMLGHKDAHLPNLKTLQTVARDLDGDGLDEIEPSV